MRLSGRVGEGHCSLTEALCVLRVFISPSNLLMGIFISLHSTSCFYKTHTHVCTHTHTHTPPHPHNTTHRPVITHPGQHTLSLSSPQMISRLNPTICEMPLCGSAD